MHATWLPYASDARQRGYSTAPGDGSERGREWQDASRTTSAATRRSAFMRVARLQRPSPHGQRRAASRRSRGRGVKGQDAPRGKEYRFAGLMGDVRVAPAGREPPHARPSLRGGRAARLRVRARRARRLRGAHLVAGRGCRSSQGSPSRCPISSRAAARSRRSHRRWTRPNARRSSAAPPSVGS